MAIFYTDSGSLRDLTISGSTVMSASRGIALQVRSSGSTIFSVSGSGGEIFNISDIGSSTALFTVASGSTNILNVDNTKNVSVSGSLIVTGSAFIRGLGTTTQTNVVTINTSTGQLYYTASSAVGSAAATPTFIATGSVTASVDIGSTMFQIASASAVKTSISNLGVQTWFLNDTLNVPAGVFSITTPQTNPGFVIGTSGSNVAITLNRFNFANAKTYTYMGYGEGATYGTFAMFSSSANINIGYNTVSGPNDTGYKLMISSSGVSGSFNANNTLIVSSSYVTINTLLTLPTMSSLPVAPPTGTIASSGSGVDCKLYFFNGTWNALF